MTAGHIKVFDSKGELLSADALKNSSIEGSEVTVENPKYSFQVESPRCNLLSNGELVVESDKDDIQVYYFTIYYFKTQSYYLVTQSIAIKISLHQILLLLLLLSLIFSLNETITHAPIRHIRKLKMRRT